MFRDELAAYTDIVAELEQENARLKRENAELQSQFDIYRSLTIQSQLDSEFVNIIRRRTCDKIRTYIHSKECQINGMNFIGLLHKLDEIERGEE